MSMSAADGCHEFVVPPELAGVAERLGLPLHAGDRVKLEVIDGGGNEDVDPGGLEPWPPAWVGSITTDDQHLATRARDVLRTELRPTSSLSPNG